MNAIHFTFSCWDGAVLKPSSSSKNLSWNQTNVFKITMSFSSKFKMSISGSFVIAIHRVININVIISYKLKSTTAAKSVWAETHKHRQPCYSDCYSPYCKGPLPSLTPTSSPFLESVLLDGACDLQAVCGHHASVWGQCPPGVWLPSSGPVCALPGSARLPCIGLLRMRQKKNDIYITF